ncbi:hypothetical protein [Streptomyces venezuelae]|uniref:hypothetical protein n=1 Tax=Streptomyces venezuelae TaxID=54571 RepID=UPI001680FFA0|nr:hypothetical protein [Streptomyces venezuelae]
MSDDRTYSYDEDNPYIDSNGDPHAPQSHDIDGVPYSTPVCGWDGEGWPCETVRDQA